MVHPKTHRLLCAINNKATTQLCKVTNRKIIDKKSTKGIYKRGEMCYYSIVR